MSQTEFHSLINKLVTQYDQLLKENNELKIQVSSLQAQLSSLNSKTLATPEKNPTFIKKPSITFWQMKTKIPVEWKNIQIDFSDSILCSHLSNNETVAFGTSDSQIYLYSLLSMTSIGTVSGHRGAINCIVSDPLTHLFASCSGDSTICIWSGQPDENLFPSLRRSSFENDKIAVSTTLSHHKGPVLCGTWILGDSRLVTGSTDNTLCYWDVTHSSSCYKVEEIKNQVVCLDSGYENSIFNFVCGLSNGEINLFDQRSNQGIINSLIHCKGICNNTKFIQDNYPHLISTGTDSKLKEWDLRSPNEPNHIIELDHIPTKIDIKNNYVVCPCETGRTRVINLKTGNLILFDQNPFSYTISSAIFLNNDCNNIICTSWDGTASIAKFFPP